VRQLKTLARSRLAFLMPFWRKVRRLTRGRRPPEETFTDIYRRNRWGDSESRSGAGSNREQSAAVRAALPLLLPELGCRRLLDIPCGDFYWMNLVELEAEYVGGDIVPELMERNQRRFGGQRRRFLQLDIVHDSLPPADVLLCRDCLVHLSHDQVKHAVRNLKRSEITYLLTTTFVHREFNEDIRTGEWRPLNLQRPPFGFPPPLRLIDEQCSHPEFRDKALGLWRVADLPGS
jgi:hypothetical protein